MRRSRSVALVSVVAGILVFGSCGGGGQPRFNATPLASGLFPSVITAGSDPFQMAVTGTGFISGSTGVTFINWNGSPRSSTLNSTTGQILVQIFASDVAAPNSVTITATNPGPGGGTSLTGPTFTIEPVQPGLTITSLDPSSQKAGGNAFMLTVNGTGFTQGDIINWNGSELITNVPPMQSTQVNAQVTQDLIATAGTASVSVSQADQTVATTSTTFTITGANNLAPDVSTLSPSSTAHGGGDFELRISGSNFAPTAFVLWNGSFRATSVLSASQVVAYIQAADILNAGNATVAVTNPAPGGGNSKSLMFKID